MDYQARNQNFPASAKGAETAEPDLGEVRQALPLTRGITSKADAQFDRAPRLTLFIRAAKLVSPHGEFVCVVRDVSETGVRLRLFHDPPKGDLIELYMANGKTFAIEQVWHKGNEAGFRFPNRIELDEFIAEEKQFPRRGLRLNLMFPVKLSSLKGQDEAIVENLSQQGACFACEGQYAIDQNLKVECPEDDIQFGEVSAKVRWRRESAYGVVFENTLSLEEFAKLAARLQCPELLA